jgi:hypothetical protein
MQKFGAVFGLAALDVLVLTSKNPQGARQFQEYIKMPATVALLARYRFSLPNKNSSREKP